MSGHREALLEGAIQCVHKRGWANTTARDIVAASGTNLGSIGYHYGSKDALMREAVCESFRRWFMPLIEMAGSTGAGFHASVARLFAELEDQRPLLASHFEAFGQAQRDDELRDFIAARYAEFRDAIAAQLGGGPEAGARAARLMGALDGAMIQWLLGVEPLPEPGDLLQAGRERP